MKLKDIRIDGGTQSRLCINPDIISEYLEVIDKLPPVTVYFDGVSNWLADGFHRYHVHKQSNKEDIEATVIEGTVRDAILYSLGANAVHGLRRSNEDKRKAVMTLLNDLEWNELSEREMGKICSVSHSTIQRIRKEIEKPQVAQVPLKKPNKPNKPSEPNKPNEPIKPAPSTKDAEDLKMLSIAHEELAEENAGLMDKLAIKQMDATPEEKAAAQETMTSLRLIIKNLETELNAVKISRDQFQNKCAELVKQCKYWENRFKKGK